MVLLFSIESRAKVRGERGSQLSSMTTTESLRRSSLINPEHPCTIHRHVKGIVLGTVLGGAFSIESVLNSMARALQLRGRSGRVRCTYVCFGRWRLPKALGRKKDSYRDFLQLHEISEGVGVSIETKLRTCAPPAGNKGVWSCLIVDSLALDRSCPTHTSSIAWHF